MSQNPSGWDQVPADDFPEVGPEDYASTPPLTPADAATQVPATEQDEAALEAAVPARPARKSADADTEVTRPESNVPLPETRYKYPFEELEVGDSFAVKLQEDIPDEIARKKKLNSMRSSLSSSATMYGRRHGIELTVRKTGDTTFRCWRVA